MDTHPLLLGHRGARFQNAVTENTLAAFDLALAAGCDGFEFDVRLTADGQPVICHDAIAHRLEIARFSAAQLGLPSLQDVLQRYQQTAFLDIELKVPGLESITADLLRKHAPVRGAVVSSFLPDALQRLYRLDAAVPLGLICETREQWSRWPQLPIAYVIPQYELAGPELISEVKSAGKKIMVWTVNASADMKRCAEWGVDGIISDNPRQLASCFTAEEKA